MKNEYGFHGRLKQKFPSQIIVDVTEICNLQCTHCPHPTFKSSEHYDARCLDPEIHKKMVDEVKEKGGGYTQYIRYTSNGEPLVHPNIYDMLDYAVENSGVFITLTTNGTIMNANRIGKLLASGLNMIDISIDAYLPDTYGKIRVGGKLSKTQENVHNLIHMRNELGVKTKIIVSFVEHDHNKKEIEEFENYWNRSGVDSVVIRRLHSAAGGVPLIAANLMSDPKNSIRRPCLYPWERITLNPKGELAFCPQDWIHGSVLEDYRKTTIEAVWNGLRYKEIRNAHLSNDYSNCSFCGNCPDWAQTRWPNDGKSYANLVENFI